MSHERRMNHTSQPLICAQYVFGSGLNLNYAYNFLVPCTHYVHTYVHILIQRMHICVTGYM